MNNYFGRGSYSRVDAHQNHFYRIFISIVMVTDKPFYQQKKWVGNLIRTSAEPVLNKCGECMISEIFHNQYPVKKKMRIYCNTKEQIWKISLVSLAIIGLSIAAFNIVLFATGKY